MKTLDLGNVTPGVRVVVVVVVVVCGAVVVVVVAVVVVVVVVLGVLVVVVAELSVSAPLQAVTTSARLNIAVKERSRMPTGYACFLLNVGPSMIF